MGIRIQPREIDIPEDDPFRNDLLSREEPVKVLSPLVRSIEGPCVRFLSASDIGLREIAQTIHRLGLVFASLRADQKWFFTPVVVALILRTLDLNLHHRCARGEASDLEVVERAFERVGGQSMRRTQESIVFESTIIAAVMDRTDDDYYLDSPFTTPLMEKYREISETYQEQGSEQTSRS